MYGRLRHFFERFRSDETGAVLVEMTLITPLLIGLSAGVFEFSNIIHQRLLIEAGVSDAARYLSRCVHLDSDKTACGTAAANLAVTGTVDGSGQQRVSGWTVADITLTYTTTPIAIVDTNTGEQNYRSSSDHVEVVDVSTSHTYTGTGLLGYLGFSPLTFSASHEERILGW